ncbi:MAG: hypothetical protein ACXAC7_19920 [Candidatus Hodarchaeales archaeon]|jgi:ribonuclease P protein subunit RPR2
MPDIVKPPGKKQKKRIHRRSKRRTNLKRINRAKSQIYNLFNITLSTTDLNLKRRYIKHIRAIAQKVQLPIPRSLRYRFCRRCSEPFTALPISTVRIRVRSKPAPHIVYTCLKCNYIRRRFYNKKDSMVRNVPIQNNLTKNTG